MGTQGERRDPVRRQARRHVHRADEGLQSGVHPGRRRSKLAPCRPMDPERTEPHRVLRSRRQGSVRRDAGVEGQGGRSQRAIPDQRDR